MPLFFAYAKSRFSHLQLKSGQTLFVVSHYIFPAAFCDLSMAPNFAMVFNTHSEEDIKCVLDDI